jgi:TolB-like protein
MRNRHLNALAWLTFGSAILVGGAAAASGATKVLVLPLHSVGEPGHYDWIAQAVAEDLQSDARQNSQVQVLSATSQPADSAAAMAAGKQAGADITIFGSYQVVGDLLRINCTAIDADRQTLASPAATGAVKDLFVMEDKLAAEIDRILPARPGATVAAAQPPAPAPYNEVNPNVFNIPGMTDASQPAPAPAPLPQAGTQYYYASTPYVYYLPEYSVPPVYYPDATSYCYTTYEPYYPGYADWSIWPGISVYNGFDLIYGDQGISRRHFGNGGFNGGEFNGGGFRGGAGPVSAPRPPSTMHPLRPPTPVWGGTPTPLGFNRAPLGAGGGPAHLNTIPLGAGGGGFGGRR